MPKLKKPSLAIVEQALYVALILAVLRFLLSRFGGPLARVSSYF